MKFGTHDTISATDLVRNLSGAIDNVRMSGNSLYITKGLRTVAELCPPPKTGFSVNKLAGLLKSLPKLGKDVSAMTMDLEYIKRQAFLPDNPWD